MDMGNRRAASRAANFQTRYDTQRDKASAGGVRGLEVRAEGGSDLSPYYRLVVRARHRDV
jgi:hypothetical protein